jgi:predicted O-methyltransferase YrrM
MGDNPVDKHPDPILEDCFLPPYAGSDEHQDFHVVRDLAVSLEPSNIIELGTAYGNLTANLSQLAPDAQIYTVNAEPEETTGDATTTRLTEQEIGRVYKSRGLSSRVAQIYENTLNLDLGEYMEKDSAELAVIDACHDTEYVINDFHKVYPYVADGGIILFHDTHPGMASHLVGSYRACLMLQREGFPIAHVKGTWWGAHRKNAPIRAR